MSIHELFNSSLFTAEKHIPRKRILDFVIWSLLIIFNLNYIPFFHLLPQNWHRWLGILIIIDVSLPLLLVVNHHGRTNMAAILLLAELWILITLLALTAGGIHAPAVLGYCITVAIAAMLFGGKGVTTVSIACSLTALGFVVLETIGHLPGSRVTHTALTIWIVVLATLQLIAFFQLLAYNWISSALAHARREIALRRQAEAALKYSEQRYREVFETTSDSIFLVDVTPEGSFFYQGWNPMCEKVVRLTASEVIGKQPAEVFPPDVARNVTENYKHCVTQKTAFTYEQTIYRTHTSKFYFQTTLIPLKNGDGRIYRIVGVAHDVTSNKAAEAALCRARDELEVHVHERTAQLEKVNKELEAFSYSVSHDLRRPLRAAIGFSDLLMTDYGRNLPADAQNLLTMIRESADYMNHLIEALLSLSRIDRQPLVPRPVNLNNLVRPIIQELQAEQPNRHLDFRVADLPDCMGEPQLLRQVFVNLLSNAVKFTCETPVAVIEINFKNGNANTVYFVRDNGAGFDMHNAGRLFGVFQRLHSSKQFGGTGVGLSIVQRIIHRHGGRIWAEAAVNQGATFYFTLPRVEQKPSAARGEEHSVQPPPNSPVP